ncbi:hypothetical protein HHK36_012788 [Tetracentron sinense]|uniref:C2H2-type domain-containing protein n=1 Tax=Tetracentron sinense TaxID=13715 RepID=A0A834ZDI2_TETSI|nr:hypothetical protein HHK36_012788 [Tetracentron sinense]
MERNSLSNMEDSGVGGSSLRESSSSNKKVKDSWDCNNHGFGGDIYQGEFSWPPRSYRCSFCKREFRSAQALGGHMNVHRRDRARLRQSPPLDVQCPNLNLNPNPNPNPNPNFSPSSPSAMLPPFTYSFPSLLSPSLTRFSSPSLASNSETTISSIIGSWHNPSSLKGRDLSKMKSLKDLFGTQEFKGITQEDEYKVLKKEESVRLALEIGLIKDSKKEDLDLELRLGYT